MADTTTTKSPVPSGAESTTAVEVACLINGAMLVATLLAFELLLRWPRARQYLTPRLVRAGDGAAFALPGGLFGWVRHVWKELRQPLSADPDAAAFIGFLELCFKLSLCGTALAVVLVPVYYTAEERAAGFDQFGLANVARGSPRYWGVVVAAYALTGAFAWFALGQWRHFLKLRVDHYIECAGGALGPERAQAMRTLLLERVPKGARTEAALMGHFGDAFGPGSVHSCVLVPRTWPAEAATGTTTDMQAEPLAEGTAAASQAADQVFAGERRPSSTAFLTFHSAARAAEARRSRLKIGHERLIAAPAPEPCDIIWANATVPRIRTWFRRGVSRALCTLGVLFWSVPVALIQAWANVSNLEKWIPGIRSLQQSVPFLYAFLVNYLPVIALIALQSLLPTILQSLATKLERQKCKSQVQRIVYSRYFCFLIASLFLTVLAGSIWDSLSSIMKKPEDAVDFLGKSIPKVGLYFLIYVLTKAGGAPLLLLQLGPLVMGLATKKEPAKVSCQYGSQAADPALVFAIALTYACIVPSIMPACVIYFGLLVLVYRWLFLHTYESEYDGAGSLWFDIFNGLVWGLLLGTLSIIALACLRDNKLQALLLAPLPVFDVALACYCWWNLGRAARDVPFSEASSADEHQAEHGGSAVFSRDLYKPPSPDAPVAECAGPTAPPEAEDTSGKADVVSFGSPKPGQAAASKGAQGGTWALPSPGLIGRNGAAKELDTL